MQTFRGQLMHTRRPACLHALDAWSRQTSTHTHTINPHWTDQPTENGERCSGSQSNALIGWATKTNSQLEQIEAMQNKQLLPFWTVSGMEHPERYQWTERLSTTSVKCNSMKAAGTLWDAWTKNFPTAKWPQKSHILQIFFLLSGDVALMLPTGI